jgi:hypothetical protein
VLPGKRTTSPLSNSTFRSLFVSLSFALLFQNSIGQNFYDQTVIQKIEITFLQTNWDYQLDTAKAGADGSIQASQVKVNGVVFPNVSVKYKGNSSYNPSSQKNPLHIELDTYQEQSYAGIKDIKLGNNYQDPSFIREVLGYDILKNYMDCPRSNFAKVYINGAYYGVYSNTESIGKKFYSDHLYSSSHTAFKCNPEVIPGTATKCNLKYKGSDSSAYLNYYELKSTTGWNELVKLCDTVTNFTSALDRNIDMDRFIWMLAYNTSLLNLDSYNGAFCQNYYLYKDENKRFSPVIWDLNMCFAGFPFVGSGTTSIGSLNISQLQTLVMNMHATDQHWPMINAVQANPTYKRMYAAHVKTIMNEMIAAGTFSTKATQFQALIDTSVLSDQAKVYTYTDFQNGMTSNVSVGSYSVPGIGTLMTARNNYLQTQPEFTLTAPAVSVALPNNFALHSNCYVTATISNASTSWLAYRFNARDQFTKVQMFDDGAHGDGATGDTNFGGAFVLAGNHVEYYIYSENPDAGIFSPARAEHEFYQYNLYPAPSAGEVMVNEFLADNKSDVKNEFHANVDWIEIFNNTNSTYNLDNCFLSNDDNNRAKFSFPAGTIIGPKSFLIVWADDMVLPGNQLHAPFTLNKDGDQIYFGNGSDAVLDQISFGAQSNDVSLGRCPDGTGAFALQNYPSYAQYNCTVGMQENNELKNVLIAFPIPADRELKVLCSEKEIAELGLYNILGTKILTTKVAGETSIDISAIPSGIYFLQYKNNSKKLIIQH